jgi:hypothetical protein
MAVLGETHEIARFALFDQFPWTHHMEAGAAPEAQGRLIRAVPGCPWQPGPLATEGRGSCLIGPTRHGTDGAAHANRFILPPSPGRRGQKPPH